ncbi:MAG TPA: SIMPL domain-containing protein, partial [Burkholderiaceae bacterium]|nr:SIMPL domain-containing protein [Burkholderiaceae bacterium]
TGAAMPASDSRSATRAGALRAAFAFTAAITAALCVATPPAATAQAQRTAQEQRAGEPQRAGEYRRAARTPQLSLSASAYRDVVQDRVTVTLYAERESPQPAAGQAQVSELLGPVLERLKARSELQVQSSGYRTDPVWQQSRIVGWRTRGAIQVSARPSDEFNRLIGELATKLNLESVGYWLSRDAQLATERELIAEAVSAFRAKADAATKALDFRSFAVRQVAVDGGGPAHPVPVPKMAMSRAGAAEAAPVPLPGAEGRTTVTVTVTGTVALEP